MKRTTTCSVVVYTTEKCTLCEMDDVANVIASSANNAEALPANTQLDRLQSVLISGDIVFTSQVLILVPDVWLSFSTQTIEAKTPDALLPLAALSSAAQTTFSSPDNVLFLYRTRTLPSDAITLDIVACTSSLANALAKPFINGGVRYLIMPFSQWAHLKTGAKSWSYLKRNALCFYQPDSQKRLKHKRLWVQLILLSVVLHTSAYLYLSLLHEQSHQSKVTRQALLDKSSAWENDQQANAFVASALTFIQALPKKTRLLVFDGAEQTTSFQVTLLSSEKDALLERWQQQQPSWQWEVTKVEPRSFSLIKEDEVVDVFISIHPTK